ncbi:hypothetical protein ACWGJ2_05500 [Streptomyces sp. NPDC054796]
MTSTDDAPATDASRARRWLRPLGIAVGGVTVAVVALGVIVYFGFLGGPPPDVDESDLTGVWKGDQGGEMHFREDGGFSATNISLGADCAPGEGAPAEGARISGTGTWKLEDFPDEGPGADIAFRPDSGRVEKCRMRASFPDPDTPSKLYLMHEIGGHEVYKRK